MSKIKGLSTTISVSDVTIAYVYSISGPGTTVGTVESTDLSDTWRSYLPTVTDGGEVSFEIHYDPDQATHTTLNALLGTPAIEDWDITFADTSTISFDGILTGFEKSGMEVDGIVTASITIKVDGEVTVTPSGGSA